MKKKNLWIYSYFSCPGQIEKIKIRIKVKKDQKLLRS